ncbi:MAG: bifunctional folylpolyglutamate synthase/dihydrofolate synthase [Muribaculaceae bacterium]|nr:bifunctional folylpolyglutamate synthase/dihydrofolate synthase [Muribaculaceae bacterium]
MTYQESIEYLYNQLPAFERQGASGYKPGLGTAITLDDWLGNPHRAYRCIHIAGTNGKGSVANLIAATLQASGYRVGLFTSPHLVDFRERIRVNGVMIDKRSVSRFVERFLRSNLPCKPSFFELTTALAFEHFRKQKVDFAIIEVGLGGRLDSSNIITPILSIITNISLDHTQFLGNTLAQIAGEKAGIIKPEVPVVVGEAGEKEVREVFENTARQCNAPIVVAQDEPLLTHSEHNADGTLHLDTATFGSLTCQLAGDYQVKNANTVLHAIKELKEQGVKITKKAVADAFAHVCQYTGFMGRWMVIGHNPLVICDAGHNAGAWELQSKQLAALSCDHLHMVLGFAADKDVNTVLGMMPKDAVYYFTQAQSARSMKAQDLQALASKHGLKGDSYPKVQDAYNAAITAAATGDAVFVGGSFYVLGELFSVSRKLLP